MKAVCARPGDSINDAPRGFPVLRRISTSQHGKLLNGFDSKSGTQRTARSPIRVVVDADSIEPVVVLLRTASGDRHLHSEPALASSRSDIQDTGLSVDCGNAR